MVRTVKITSDIPTFSVNGIPTSLMEKWVRIMKSKGLKEERIKSIIAWILCTRHLVCSSMRSLDDLRKAINDLSELYSELEELKEEMLKIAEEELCGAPIIDAGINGEGGYGTRLIYPISNTKAQIVTASLGDKEGVACKRDPSYSGSRGLKSFVCKAQMFYERAKEKSFDVDKFGTPKIVVVGCGGSGNNTINRLENIGVDDVLTIAVNTDRQHLEMIKADKKILIGRSLTKGLGAGGYPEVGRKAAEMARGTFEELLSDADLVFVCAGMGGGTGTGSAPVIAEIAKKQGAIVIGMVQTPFRVEKARIIKAEKGLDELRKNADTVVVLDNNKLLEYVPNLPIEQAFSVMDQLVAETIKGISDAITKPSLINLDLADVRAVMGHGGVAAMLVGETKGQNRAKEVVKDCLTHPLLDIDYKGATGALIHISGGPDLTIKEAEEIVENLTFEMDNTANVVWGARIERELEGVVRVIAIMTGIKSPSEYSEFEKAVRSLDKTIGGDTYKTLKTGPLEPKISRMGIDVL